MSLPFAVILAMGFVAGAEARFLSTDPADTGKVGSSQSWNRYAYVQNNPVGIVDPDGRWLETAFDVAMAGISIKQAWDNPSFGNIAGAVVDVAAVVVPVVPAVGGRAIDAAQAGAKVVDAAQAANKVENAADAGSVARVHGNSKASTAPQHRYTIEDAATGDVQKTGISGQPLNRNGTSPRANRQTNQINRQEGEGAVQATVHESDIPGRAAALEVEREATSELAAQGNSLSRQIRPKPE